MLAAAAPLCTKAAPTVFPLACLPANRSATTHATPVPINNANAETCVVANPSTTNPSSASSFDFTATRPSDHTACTINATTTGFTPYNNAPISGALPYFWYTHARIPTNTADGKINEHPAINNPAIPPRNSPK